MKYLRLLKLSSLFMIFKRANTIKNLLKTLLLSIPVLMDITVILFLIYFIYSIIGCLLFK